MLPNALAFGLQEVNPDSEPLKNLDDDVPIGMPDTSTKFSLAGGQDSHSCETTLQVLSHAWGDYNSRYHMPDDIWIENLIMYIDTLVNLRIAHVCEWISSNVARFQNRQASIDELMRTFKSATVDLKSNLQLCKLKCGSCELLCIQSRLHDGQHDCQTSHHCVHSCDFYASSGEMKACSMSRQECLDECTKVISHAEDVHLCAATVHACGQPCNLSKLRLSDGSTPPCHGTCGIVSDVDHDNTCAMLGFVLSLANFARDSVQIQTISTAWKMVLFISAASYREEHSCPMQCTVEGICKIKTVPQSIEATFTGRHETFQYTKVYSQGTFGTPQQSVSQAITPGHPQQEHETRHGSMSSSRWAVDGPDDTDLKHWAATFTSTTVVPRMLLLAEGIIRTCQGLHHTQPFLVMGWFQGSLFLGGASKFHQVQNAAQPSYCTLPLFHLPMDPNNAQVGLGYVSNDGHIFSCRNPVIMQQAFHVRSGSMASGDRRPLLNMPASDRIV
ncbi:hypothetical protein BD769DRAFT_1391798 [Suillus cothurnatus]|nr:hypothetical protein BD769DRAFT_1391798 [Suillus cothurnatus]